MKKKCLSLLLMFIGIMVGNAQVKISFEVSFIEPQAHYAEVEMNISGLAKTYVDVKMPVWQPGSYLIREFAKNVEDFKATASGKPVRLKRSTKIPGEYFLQNLLSLKQIIGCMPSNSRFVHRL